MEAVSANEQEKKKSRLKTMRTAWALFMVLIVMPGWLSASVVEGLDFSQAVHAVGQNLMGFGIPGPLVGIVVYPATLFAMILPASSLVVIALISILGLHYIPFAIVLIAAIMASCVEPPFYQDKKRKIDPEAYDEEQRTIKKPFFSGKPFRYFVAFMVIAGLAGEVLFANQRMIIADDYKGSVYLYDDATAKKIPLESTVKLSIIDPGMVFDKKPGVNLFSLRLEFDGKDVETLKQMGIDPRLFKQNEYLTNQYSKSVCTIDTTKSTVQKYDAKGFTYLSLSALRSYHYVLSKSYDEADVNCPQNVHFALMNFDEAQMAIDHVSNKYIIVAELERDSRLSWIQRSIMKWKLSNNYREAL